MKSKKQIEARIFELEEHFDHIGWKLGDTHLINSDILSSEYGEMMGLKWVLISLTKRSVKNEVLIKNNIL